jgi:hypothetical protein
VFHSVRLMADCMHCPVILTWPVSSECALDLVEFTNIEQALKDRVRYWVSSE